MASSSSNNTDTSNPRPMAHNGSKSNTKSNSQRVEFFLEEVKKIKQNLPSNAKDLISRIPNEVDKLCKELEYIKTLLSTLQKFQSDLTKPLDTLEKNIKDIDEGTRILSKGEEVSLVNKQSREIEANIKVLRSNITKLKIKIPLQNQPSISSSEAARDFQKTIASSKFGELPSLCEGNGEKLKETKVYKEMKRMFENDLIDNSIADSRERRIDVMRKQLCLLCFAVFPEDAEIRRRLLHLWWIGEDLLPKEDSASFADKALEEFVRMGLIEPVKAESRPDGDAKSFKMHPLIRASLIELAKEARFFDFDSKGNPSRTNFYESKRVGFVKKTIEEEEEEKKNIKSKEAREGLKKLRTLFNVSEQFPDLRIPLRYFTKMKEIGVVYFGRWESTAKRHIEVDSVEFLKALSDKKKLRFLSLQGMSRVTDIPAFGVYLRDLRILDLRACYNLEQLPKDLDFLRSLTYFDISECYLLDFMPRSLALLTELKVLKGFVVSDKWKSCSLRELAGLKKLEKLGIIINTNDFKIEKWGNELSTFQKLVKLKISWGGTGRPEKKSQGSNGEEVPKKENKNQKEGKTKIPPTQGSKGGEDSTKTEETIEKKEEGKNHDVTTNVHKSLLQGKASASHDLVKLDLESFPKKELPEWMGPKYFRKLKKLYIRGGKIRSLENVLEDGEKWEKVEILRLKYLNELKMDWEEIQDLFPNLWYLEKVKCPKITLCPCDGNGVWIDHEKRERMKNLEKNDEDKD